MNEKRKPDGAKVARGVRLILEGIGEDPEREGLRRTPGRVAEMYLELTAGLWEDASAAVTPLPCREDREDCESIVVVRDINLASVCEHHLTPFAGQCHIAYLPQGGRIAGLSTLARVAETLARRLQVQERLVADIARALDTGLKPRGVMVVMEAVHTCMTLRGAKKPGASAVASTVLGIFREQPAARAEALSLIFAGRR